MWVMHLQQEIFIARDISWINEPQDDVFDAMVKIRYNTPPAPARCEKMGNDVKVTFSVSVSAITPGQIAAFYDPGDEEIWGGGYIEKYLQHTEFVPGSRDLPAYDEVCGIFR